MTICNVVLFAECLNINVAHRVGSMQLWGTWRRMTGGGIFMTPWRDPIGWETKTLFTTWQSRLLQLLWRWDLMYISYVSKFFFFLFGRFGSWLGFILFTLFLMQDFFFLPHHQNRFFYKLVLTWCCCTSFPAGELWHAIQPHWRWKDLPEGLWWSKSQVWKRRPGPPLLLCSRQDRTLPTAYTLWKGNSALSLYIKAPISLRSSWLHGSIFPSVFYLVTSLWHQLFCWVLRPGPSDGKWRV